jgi:hypothetical protein
MHWIIGSTSYDNRLRDVQKHMRPPQRDRNQQRLMSDKSLPQLQKRSTELPLVCAPWEGPGRDVRLRLQHDIVNQPGDVLRKSDDPQDRSMATVAPD